jgi:hypothetical protein
MRRKRAARTLLLLSALALAPSALANEALRVGVTPETLSIGALYEGTEVSVTGELPPDCEAVVRIIGTSSDLSLKKKGKVFEILWMNRETVVFEDIPGVFLISTSGNPEKVLGQPCENDCGWQLGLPALFARTKISPESPDKRALFQELLQLKKSEGLYVTSEGLHYANVNDLRRTFEARISLSSRFPPGKYAVEVYALREGKVIDRATRDLTARLEGLPAILSVLAFNHGALYGILATVIAIGAGLFTGFVFGTGKGGH